MTYFELTARITRDPEICHGKPCIRNMRIPVDVVHHLLKNGTSKETILSQYPDLEPEDLQAVETSNKRKPERVKQP